MRRYRKTAYLFLTPFLVVFIAFYLAPVGLWLTLDSGTFDGVEFNQKTHAVRLGMVEAAMALLSWVMAS